MFYVRNAAKDTDKGFTNRFHGFSLSNCWLNIGKLDLIQSGNNMPLFQVGFSGQRSLGPTLGGKESMLSYPVSLSPTAGSECMLKSAKRVCPAFPGLFKINQQNF